MATLAVQHTAITGRLQVVIGVDHSGDGGGWTDLSATGATGAGDIEQPPMLPYVAIVPREVSAEAGPPLNSYTYTMRVEFRCWAGVATDAAASRMTFADRVIYDCYRAIQEDFASDAGVGSLFRLCRTLEFGDSEIVGVSQRQPGRAAEGRGEVTLTFLVDAGY